MVSTTEKEAPDRTGRNFIRKHAIWFIAIVGLSVLVRAGTAYFMVTHLDDAGWFQYGSYSIFDQRAQNIIDGREPVFFLSDPSRTDLIQYPPAFPVMMAIIYVASGERSAYSVVRVQWLLDAIIMPLLLMGIAASAFGWRVAKAAGIFAALSPLAAICGVTPTSEASSTWLIMAAIWILLVAYRRQKWYLSLAAGVTLGAACWFRVNPLFLVGAWTAAVLLFAAAPARIRFRLSLALTLGTIVVVAPITVRNIVVFDEFVLTGLNVGSNLWEGLGETEFGRQHGFKFGDQVMVETEREELGLPSDFPITPVWPDGIRRDRERARRSLELIGQHPIWYAGVMLTRMYWMLKIAGEPGPYYGTAGINCTSEKCLPPDWRNGPAAFVVTLIGMGQSVHRYTAMLLAAVGIWFGFRRNWAASWLLLATVLYYLVPGTAAHTELRYVLPMHAMLIVFAGLGFTELAALAKRGLSVFRPRSQPETV